MKWAIKMQEMLDNHSGVIRKITATGEMGKRTSEMGLVPDAALGLVT